MNNTPNRASNPAPKPRRKDAALDLGTARAMLPLVRGILTDIQTQAARIADLAPQQDRLDRHRRDLSWAERNKRYSLQDDIAAAERALATAAGELDTLGVALVDPLAGEVDFPARINGRSAAFSYRAEESVLAHWHYAGETTRRPIPADWQAGVPLRPSA